MDEKIDMGQQWMNQSGPNFTAHPGFTTYNLQLRKTILTWNTGGKKKKRWWICWRGFLFLCSTLVTSDLKNKSSRRVCSTRKTWNCYNSVQRRATEVVWGLEHPSCEKRWHLSFPSLEKKKLLGKLWAAFHH